MSALQQVLSALAERPGVAGAMLLSDEGLPVAATLPPGVDIEAVAAHAATVWRGLATLGSVTGAGNPEEIVTEAPGGVTILRRLGPGTTIFVLADGDAPDVGALLHDLRRHASVLLASS
jgi:predicted regulator of Ras-like GTPase activity (Roadblock/LC7/MglB family)